MQQMPPSLLLRKRMSSKTLEEGDRWTQKKLYKSVKVKVEIMIKKKLILVTCISLTCCCLLPWYLANGTVLHILEYLQGS